MQDENETAINQRDSATTILLIDDDIKYCRLISKYLSEHGFAVTSVHDGKTGIEAAMSSRWDAVIIDIMLPGLNGYEVLRTLRSHCGVPILMLTALSDETDRVVGLELGADDYLPKSFSPREMLARLRAVLRRFQRAEGMKESQDSIVVGGLSIQPESRTVKLNGSTVKLTSIEFDLLLSLARAKGRIKTREQLMNEVKTDNCDSYDRSIDVHVSVLRKKLNDDAKNPFLIKTVRSVGYTLVDPDLDES